MDDIKYLHQRLAALMHEIHKICVNNNIRYSMIGGTLIGAIRHKGFIPWDDDIDIAMPYEDYRTFIRKIKSLEHEWVEFDIPDAKGLYYNTFVKAYDKRTTFIENSGQAPKGIFIDIFPIICIGNTKFEAICKLRYFRLLDGMLRRKGYSFATGTLREHIFNGIAFFFSREYLFHKIQTLSSKYAKNQKKYSSDVNGTVKGIVPSKLWKEYKLYDFEQYKFYGLKNAHEYLSSVFGDYMQLPPLQNQKPHHVYYIDLNTPYANTNFNYHEK